MSKTSYSVIIPKDVFPKPDKKEMSAVYILLDFFKADIKFIPRNNCKTPTLMQKLEEINKSNDCF